MGPSTSAASSLPLTSPSTSSPLGRVCTWRLTAGQRRWKRASIPGRWMAAVLYMEPMTNSPAGSPPLSAASASACSLNMRSA